MTTTRHRFVGDKMAFEFAVETDGTPTPIPSATLEAAVLAPDGTILAAAAAWLASPDDHVVRVTVAKGATEKIGKHALQLKITDPSLAEPIRGQVFLELQPSAI